MKYKYNIGVIGLGHVGYPLYSVLKYHYDNVFGYDINGKYDSWDDILDTSIVFLCVPTNEGGDGRLDMSNIDNILVKLDECRYSGIVVIKSTMRLEYVTDAVHRYKLDIVVFPEWLREVSSLKDTVSPEMIVIGGTDSSCVEVIDIFTWYRDSKIFKVEPEEAVLIKLSANALASTKITFANQIGLIAQENNIDGNKVMDVLKQDPRCSPRYLTPGKQYGGHCLPKDTKELSNSSGNTSFIKSVIEFNRKYENEQ